jgi:nitrate reductase NapE component
MSTTPEDGAPQVPPTEELQAKVSERLNEALQGLSLPEPQKREVITRVREMFVALIDRGGTPTRLDPETARLLTEAANREADHKLTYLTQKQAHTAAAEQRADDYRLRCHEDAIKLIWPILSVVLVVIVGSMAFAVWLIVSGKENIGIPILSAIVSGVLAYLAGFGTPRDLWPGGSGHKDPH